MYLCSRVLDKIIILWFFIAIKYTTTCWEDVMNPSAYSQFNVVLENFTRCGFCWQQRINVTISQWNHLRHIPYPYVV
jgi:hypothetical protein